MGLDSKALLNGASEARLKSSASTPSLRSREAQLVPMGRNTPGNEGGNVRVVVRVRGFLPREIQRGAECLIKMDPVTQTTKLLAPNDKDPANAKAQSRRIVEEKSFTFDNSFWSHDPEDEHFAQQEDVYNALGEEFLDHNFEGYHTCIFAYGQTGSGKSYTMMGTPEQPGIIPRTCEDLFERIESSDSPNVSYTVRVSYFEVYNEHVRDLLSPPRPSSSTGPNYLKIREHPVEGPYVKDLTDVPVKNYADLLRFMHAGDAARTTASTKMNDTSSRSHAVFTIMLKQIHHDLATDSTTERTARIRLVDLAGSERAKATEATGQRLREGSNINKSLTTLGRVIAALADPRHARMHSNGGGAAAKRSDVVPYRDSILTWLLKDSLGGNSKTAMIACIAPSDHDETLSTLRYADQAKRIRTRAVVNQDSISAAQRDAQIAEMQATIRELQTQVSAAHAQVAQESQRAAHHAKQAASVAERLARDEKLDEYQEQVARMQRLMEEERLVNESKIRQLVEQNEALRLHLRLAVDSIKNPIPSIPAVEGDKEDAVANAGTRSVSGASRTYSIGTPPAETLGVKKRASAAPPAVHVVDSTGDEDKENEPVDSADKDVSNKKKPRVSDVSIDGTDLDAPWWDAHHQQATEADVLDMQGHMEDLLTDLGMFRRKVADDHARFGIRRKQPLGEISVN